MRFLVLLFFLGLVSFDHVLANFAFSQEMLSNTVTQDGPVDPVGETILKALQDCAKKRAAQPRSIAPNNRFYRRLRDHYLRDYLQNPSGETGRKVIDKIGMPSKSIFIRYLLGKEPSKEFRQVLEELLGDGLPPSLATADAVLKDKDLSPIDVPPLLGECHQADYQNDWILGGKNWSQVLHWANGVRYATGKASAVRWLFLAYELWRLEGWDVFGEDSINDMIAGEQGYLLGRELLEGRIKTEEDLKKTLDKTFAEARCWVGSLLKLRQKELDDFVTAEEVGKASKWWGKTGTDIWLDDEGKPYKSLRKKFVEDKKNIEEVNGSKFFERLCEVYALIYEAEECERKWKAEGVGEDTVHWQISPLEVDLVQGRYNEVFRILQGRTPECHMRTLFNQDELLKIIPESFWRFFDNCDHNVSPFRSW